ncbi:DUF927 domain-containing protein [Citrifermentans bremense]|uniref:DUF927 domain-containing protein n=1 Tax=Citrifermentans bremense TaxID=60035 RepID=UPI0003FBF772|nr:DUF927 domain-containing protein [Citrifermentans bremense]
MAEILEIKPAPDSVTQGQYIFSAVKGVFFVPPAKKNGESPEPVWLSSPLEIVAYTRDTDQENWGRLLAFSDPDGHLHRLSIPMAILSSGGDECIRQLLSGGLTITTNPQHRRLLSSYIQEFRPAACSMARCTDRIGWHDTGLYVLPEKSFGKSDELVIYQSSHGSSHAFQEKGSLTGWQENVGRLCVGNSRLVFAASAAFAGPLLHSVGAESGGFNLCGGSSSGKTTALYVAGSVCGSPKYLQRWRGTANGLEAVAALHNDGFLVLDELAQVDPRIAGEVVYMLANGSGKARATKSCGIKEKAAWRLLFLSAGEISLSTHMASAGKESMAGQETRLADVPADAGKGMGIFEDIHGMELPSRFADALKQNAAANHGTPLAAWLEKLSDTSSCNLEAQVKAKQKDFMDDLHLEGAGGQVYRVAERFSLVAAAGELATKLGITGWKQGEAARSVTTCLQAWLSGRDGTDQSEHEKMRAKVRHFLEQHGESRFVDLDWLPDARPINNRAGFRSLDKESGAFEYFVLPGAWTKEICTGCNAKTMSRYLAEQGYLEVSASGNPYITRRFPGINPTKCYHVLPSLFDDGEHTEGIENAPDPFESAPLSVEWTYDPSINPFAVRAHPTPSTQWRSNIGNAPEAGEELPF